MVFSPSTYLVSAAVACVALQMQQVSAGSLYYGATTVTETQNEISEKSPLYGGEVDDQDCAVQVTIDPTLPNITTILPEPVEYPDLLANLTTAPADPVFTKVGEADLSEECPTKEADLDAYLDSKAPWTTTGTPTKTGIDTPKDCATGWDDSTIQAKVEKKRRLEANGNADIAKLEAFFGTKMEMTLKDLPTQGVHTPSPWAGPYWPTYQDSINVVWSQGQPSPAEKYAKAFGKDVMAFMDAVSKKNGIDSQSGRKKCTSNNDCSTLTDGSECAIRAGKTSGYCIPTWFGICHAWAPAAILEAEPNCPVTYNGVTFQPMDLKALVSSVYDGARVATVFTGARYNGGDEATDEYGRHTNNAYRDLNPAYFHIANANILGKLNSTYVADVTAGAEVWNQPVRGFKVYEQTKMSLKKAAQTFYGLQKYPWNSAAKSIVYVKSRLSWIFETYTDGGLVSSGEINKYTTGQYYYYLLELDSAGEIIGGEWVYNSDDDHPDFLWLPKAKPAANTVTSIGLSYADVSMLLQKSVSCSA
ncbi:ABC transporter G family member 10 [Phytophthora nicotianae]|uniref:ABC transporter G family member 10 n=2 Tax=Phytophthora nicotianae TaxID=4792 RepID=A0A0W8BZ72_PHYNI|nr:ABC transporter G family member 10 [Phytophthora nicotianae]